MSSSNCNSSDTDLCLLSLLKHWLWYVAQQMKVKPWNWLENQVLVLLGNNLIKPVFDERDYLGRWWSLFHHAAQLYRTSSGGLNRGHKLWCGCLSILNSNWPFSDEHTCSLPRPFPWTALENRKYWFHTVFNVIVLMLLRFIWFPFGLPLLFGFLIFTWCLSSNLWI